MKTIEELLEAPCADIIILPVEIALVMHERGLIDEKVMQCIVGSAGVQLGLVDDPSS